MSRGLRISLGFGCILLAVVLLPSDVEILWTLGLCLLGAGIAQFIGLPKDNVLPFRKRNH